jgi:hypothetical protein
VNEKQKKGKNPCEGIPYDFLKDRLISELQSREERIYVKEFGTIFLTAEGPIDYRRIVHYYGLRRI